MNKAGLPGNRQRVKLPCTVCGAKLFTGRGPDATSKDAKQAGQFSRRHFSKDCAGRTLVSR